jgi:phenylacetate-coenzyme A ligase PaaK-like adenylate-forming protein
MMENNTFLEIGSQDQFEELAIGTFRFQAKHNPVYKEYLDLLSLDSESIKCISDIPFLPIEFFKSHKVYSSEEKEEICFFSSGTTGMQPSKHFVAHRDIYVRSFMAGFEHFYGNPENYCILALLPSYLERNNSSLVFMVDSFIKRSRFPESGFYLDELGELSETITSLESRDTKTILIGVSYALLDLAEKFPMLLKNTCIMETGGMKGKREELSKEVLHGHLAKAFGLDTIHSEYGMTELLSQAYSKGRGLFEAPPWMQILIRDPYDPFSYLDTGRSGGINIIDLANKYSCSFIETQDLGRVHQDKSFEVLGRFDNSDIRGCNLLVQ